MKKILVISHVWPFPGHSGQEQRVRQSLNSLRKHFHVTFLTTADPNNIDVVSEKLSHMCDRVVCMESIFDRSRSTRLFHRVIGCFFSLYSSLKLSNYVVGHVELTSKRIEEVLRSDTFDVVLYEYWHAYKTIDVFRQRNVPCVLDMHNILWAAFEQQQTRQRYVPSWLKRRRIEKYKSAEQRAWRKFDGIVAINSEEKVLVETQVDDNAKIFLAPMGIDLKDWPYVWRPYVTAPRVAYYGGMASHHNQENARDCYTNIMPQVWHEFPDAEFWIIGSNPPQSILDLAKYDKRVIVTGYVEDVQSVLADTAVVVCPWQGRYGFRSRLIEIIASGVPLVTTPDAIDGMQLENNKDILLGISANELAKNTLSLLKDKKLAQQQSNTARRTVEKQYSHASTYDKLSQEVSSWLDTRKTVGINP